MATGEVGFTGRALGANADVLPPSSFPSDAILLLRALLFVQRMISKFRRDGGTLRLAVVLNGSPLFTGGDVSGESEKALDARCGMLRA